MTPLFHEFSDQVNWKALTRRSRRDILELMIEFADLVD
jgi:hypothetical protein